ncbi:RHOMBOID-like protein 12, mitochondrial [Momordica charantia]|uniref:RHOMBOID-like protein 12, mitochondrial n=1 Tax=Momordica charantia TaxID=3673 RepID=A0A6J1C609_MOMCH|nr:RHOMBOID-like protein 12, mitochondrial [Momordica charantia]
MNKLFSLKLASRISNSTATSRPCKNCTSFATLVRTHNQNHLFGSFISRPLQDHSHSWSSQRSFAEKIHGLFSVSVVGKRFLLNSSNTLFKGSIRSLIERRFLFTGAQFSKLRFQLKPGFDFQWRGRRSWFQRLTSNDVVLGLIIANVAVFLLWRIADPVFMSRNFTISVENIRSGRVHTLITSAFSHVEVGHIVSNMIGLYFFGMNIGRVFGSEFLLRLYLAGAIGGSAFYLVHHLFQASSSKDRPFWGKDPIRAQGLGASGAVNAIMLLDIFLFPKSTLYLEFFIPVPAILLGIFLIGKDMLRILENDSQISGSAHLGGAAVAAIAWARVRRGRF